MTNGLQQPTLPNFRAAEKKYRLYQEHPDQKGRYVSSHVQTGLQAPAQNGCIFARPVETRVLRNCRLGISRGELQEVKGVYEHLVQARSAPIASACPSHIFDNDGFTYLSALMSGSCPGAQTKQ